MLRSITAQQFQEWIAYARMEPFDETRADYRVAMLAQLLANVNRDPKQKREPFTITDFLLKFGEETVAKQEPDWRRMKAMAKLITDTYRENK